MKSALKSADTENASERSPAERFQALNRARLVRAREAVTERQRDVLEMLPVLFHCNHPLLPGYVSKQTPQGIMGYAPSKHAGRICKKHIRAFELPRRALYRHDIQGLYVMGSTGTVAYTRGSDFDIWLCHRAGLERERLEELQLKANGVEQWCESFGLEVHFFVFDAADFREGRTMSLSDESSGSSQRYLLLDEFYRSGLVIAGASPLWWSIAPEQESEYESTVRELLAKRFVKEEDSIDFGGMHEVPAEEFFGAAIWQLYKSISSPYKSALKLLLMEVYADEYPDIDLLSMRYKRAVYEGESDLEKLDPYLQMYSKVEEYLMAHNDTIRLNLARRSFYVKVKEKISEERTGDNNWRRELVQSMVRKWGWDKHTLKSMDTRGNWTLDEVRSERQQLIQALTKSYRHLSAFARRQGDAHISDKDLTILGRRLYAAFERKPGKVDIITRGISAAIAEPSLSIAESDIKASETRWDLYRGHVSWNDTGESKPIRRSLSITEACCWTHFNAMIGSDTVLSISSRREDIDPRDIRHLLAVLNEHYPQGKVQEPQGHELLRRPRLRNAIVFINVGANPMQASFERGELLTSDRNDVLNFSGLKRALIVTCDLVITNSWGEVFTSTHHGEDALVHLLSDYAGWQSEEFPLPAPQVHCFTAGYGTAIVDRLNGLFADFLKALSTPRPDSNLRYVLEIGGKIHTVEISDSRRSHHVFENEARFAQSTSIENPRFCRTLFDAGSLCGSLSRKLLEQNRRGLIQVFIVEGEDDFMVHIIDECGSYLRHRIRCDTRNQLIGHLQLFLKNSCRRVQKSTGHSNIACEYYEAALNGRRRWQLKPLTENEKGPEHYCDVRVHAGLSPDNSTAFTLYVDKEEFSSVRYGSEFIRVAARHILKLRSSGLRYPVYITDIELSAALLEKQKVEELRTVSLLKYKQRIEEMLNRVLDQ